MTICYGQVVKLDKDTSKYKNPIIYVFHIKQQPPLVTYCHAGVNVLQMDSISVFTPPESVKLYGEKARIGAIVFNFKKDMIIIDLTRLLSAYNIDPAYNSLPVYINNAIAYRTEELYFEPAFIKSVNLSVEQKTGMKYIDVKTLDATGMLLKH
jgi:hypothetical protein